MELKNKFFLFSTIFLFVMTFTLYQYQGAIDEAVIKVLNESNNPPNSVFEQRHNNLVKEFLETSSNFYLFDCDEVPFVKEVNEAGKKLQKEKKQFYFTNYCVAYAGGLDETTIKFIMGLRKISYDSTSLKDNPEVINDEPFEVLVSGMDLAMLNKETNEFYGVRVIYTVMTLYAKELNSYASVIQFSVATPLEQL